MLSFEAVMGLLALCCVCLMVGFSYRATGWAPWLMLASTAGFLGLMAYSILNLL